MSEIPGDIMEAAWNCLGDLYEPDLAEKISRAILAERERCAKIVETQKVYEVGDRHMLASAIRNPKT